MYRKKECDILSHVETVGGRRPSQGRWRQFPYSKTPHAQARGASPVPILFCPNSHLPPTVVMIA